MTAPTKPNVQLILTSDEQSVLLGLIDCALKSQGLNVAINAVVLAKKINDAPVHDDTPKSLGPLVEVGPLRSVDVPANVNTSA